MQLIASQAQLDPEDLVLEIGTGLGHLTDVLLASRARVVSLEYDKNLFDVACRKYRDVANLELKHQDIRRFQFESLENDYKICANIPYYLTAYLLRLLVDTSRKPRLAVLLIQQDVAEKLVDGNRRSLLNVLLNFHYRTSLGAVIDKTKFQPPPKVQSQILILKHDPRPELAGLDTVHFYAFLKKCLAKPRKTLVNNLKSAGGADMAELAEFLESSNLGIKVRPEKLGLSDWVRLYKTTLPGR